MEQEYGHFGHADLLQGVRVLDLSDEKASFASKLLGDLGARVLRVETPTMSGENRRLSDLYHNMGKRKITLEICSEGGKGKLLDLLQKADIVIESFPLDYLATLGVSYKGVAQKNRGLIWVSVTAFGQNGRRCHDRGDDLILSASGGQMILSGEPDKTPIRPYGEQSYYLSSLFVAVSAVLALVERRTTGRGRWIDLSMQEAVAATLDHVMPRYLYDGDIAQRSGDVSWHKLSFVLPCADGRLLAHVGQTQWDTLVDWMDGEGMAGDLKDAKWKEEAYRCANFEHVKSVMERWTRTHAVADLFEIAQLMRFAWVPVAAPETVLNSPQLKARTFFKNIQGEQGEVLQMPGMPYRFYEMAEDDGGVL